MSEMVERVAMAIQKANAECIGLKYTDLTKAMARAAIEAMRTPTEAMHRAGAEVLAKYEGWGGLDVAVDRFGAFNDAQDYLAMAAKSHEAMIDAALSEASR